MVHVVRQPVHMVNDLNTSVIADIEGPTHRSDIEGSQPVTGNVWHFLSREMPRQLQYVCAPQKASYGKLHQELSNIHAKYSTDYTNMTLTQYRHTGIPESVKDISECKVWRMERS